MEEATTDSDVTNVAPQEVEETPEVEATEEQPVQNVEQESAADEVKSEADVEEVSDTSEAVEDDIKEWADKKNLPLDDPVALAKMYREAEKKMTQSNQQVSALRKQAEKQAAESGDEFEDAESRDVRLLLNQLKVTDFYMNNPNAKQYDAQMAEVLKERPHLANDLDAVYALAKSKTSAEKLDEARKEGRQDALKKISQTQRQAAPRTAATQRTKEPEVDPFIQGFDEG